MPASGPIFQAIEAYADAVGVTLPAHPPATVDSVSPSTGSILGGTTVRVEGSGFVYGATDASFAGVAGTVAAVLSDGQLDATTGDGLTTDPGTGDVQVGLGTLEDGWSYPQPTAETAAGTTTAVVTKPAGTVDGDLLIACGYMEGATGSATVALPAGFTSRATTGAGSADMAIGTKVASGEGADYTFTASGGTPATFRGVIVRVPQTIGNTWDSVSASATMATGTGGQSIPSLDPIADPHLLIVWAATDKRGGSNPFTLTIDNGPWTEMVAVTQNNTEANGICAYRYGESGASGITNVTVPGASGSVRKGGMMLAVEVG